MKFGVAGCLGLNCVFVFVLWRGKRGHYSSSPTSSLPPSSPTLPTLLIYSSSALHFHISGRCARCICLRRLVQCRLDSFSLAGEQLEAWLFLRWQSPSCIERGQRLAKCSRLLQASSWPWNERHEQSKKNQDPWFRPVVQETDEIDWSLLCFWWISS